ncbi:MAG: molybdopterin-dependent oxidoreductase [Actinomycetota bacterium]|nr:molybdopterin-dependent oxidoreductase [Actinomycetota bacterium]
MTLPPGQRAIDGFPRFGTHLHRPPPRIPTDPVIQIRGAVIEPFDVPLADLAMLPRRELAADFHCVAGWSTTNLRWEGVAFGTLYDLVLKPKLQPDKTITHVVFGGLDGFESSLLIEDALRSDVVLADVLDGRPLDPDHGTPLRLVSPSQYGYMSTKHLCAIELCTSAPTRELGAATAVARRGLRGPLILRHPRARVWEEERHPYLPAPLLRPFYRLFIKPGIERARTSPSTK